jgi:glycosyltransferase involved in cell wall biosynthesis
MYTARPVVATNVEGVPELVKNGKTGILVRPKDIQSIAQGIISLLSDEQTAKHLGQAAKQCITNSFRADVMIKELDNVYFKIISDKKKANIYRKKSNLLNA